MIHWKTLAAIAAATVLTSPAMSQTARDFRGWSPYEDNLKALPSPRLVVDPPFKDLLAYGVFQAQYRVENLRIVPVFGQRALNVSPPIGHLHVIVDDGPHWWADASDNNTVDVANLAPGPHRVTIQLVDPNHNVFPGQVMTLNFIVPETAKVAKIIR